MNFFFLGGGGVQEICSTFLTKWFLPYPLISWLHWCNRQNGTKKLHNLFLSHCFSQYIRWGTQKQMGLFQVWIFCDWKLSTWLQSAIKIDSLQQREIYFSISMNDPLTLRHTLSLPFCFRGQFPVLLGWTTMALSPWNIHVFVLNWKNFRWNRFLGFSLRLRRNNDSNKNKTDLFKGP